MLSVTLFCSVAARRIHLFHIAICDDSGNQRKAVQEALDTYLLSHGYDEVKVDVFDDPRIFLETLEKCGGWDVVLLDICMPDILGTDIARRIRERHDRTEIIFLTVSSDYAVEAFSLNAAHYVIKPFTQDVFDEAMDRALLSFEKTVHNIMLQMENGAIQAVDIDDIIFIESVGYKRVIHTKEKNYEETKQSLSKLIDELNKLSPGQFIQPYRGYIANLDAVRTISNDRMIMQDNSPILIKRGDFRKLRDVFFRWTFRNNGNI